MTDHKPLEAIYGPHSIKTLRWYGTVGRFEQCKAYVPAAGELFVIGQLVLRGTRIVLPIKLRRKHAVALAHEGHLGVVGTKKT